VASAGHATRRLPPAARTALTDFSADSGAAGALLLRGVPTGEPPATPATPTAPFQKDRVSEHAVLSVARVLGHPVGYSAEHGGRIVQNLLPTRDGTTRQISTSSRVELEFHTETAFHPFRPRYLLLLCLRADAAAQTLLCSVHEVLPHLDETTRRILRQPRFRTGVDASFAGFRPTELRPAAPVLSGLVDRPVLVFDADLMVGTDPEAAEALATLARVARSIRHGVVLDRGDLLVVDNHACIHGRTAFEPRFDGTDRWLQRSFVVTDLAPSEPDRIGSVITTQFA
jgi:alpha-ketoglutarate-dependent taurine dioxygenase